MIYKQLAKIKFLHHFGFHAGKFYILSTPINKMQSNTGRHKYCITCGAVEKKGYLK